jgi:hypothetical protein
LAVTLRAAACAIDPLPFLQHALSHPQDKEAKNTDEVLMAILAQTKIALRWIAFTQSLVMHLKFLFRDLFFKIIFVFLFVELTRYIVF